MSESLLRWPLWMAASAAATWLALRYAGYRALLDLPGQRRSHSRPTARGGGIAIVLVWLAAMTLAARGDAQAAPAWPSLLALAAVAAVGWWDDHRPQPVARRLLVHGLAALVLVAGPTFGWPVWLWLPLAALTVVAAINLCNFMDGIDGLAASQALLVASALALAFAWNGRTSWADAAWLLSAACAGFLPFNSPRARIFLGDVGSGFLGAAIGWLLWAAWSGGSLPLGSTLLLPSAFLLDAGLTLLARMRAGRDWTRPHREHLYQWLVRSGMAHFRVTACYALWTLSAAALALALRDAARASLIAAVVVYLGGALLWAQGRRGILRRRRSRSARA